ncbi:unnamed protein product [Amaranthus hypochondriacus]
MLKILALLGSGDKHASEQMYSLLGDLIRKADAFSNIENGVLFECIAKAEAEAEMEAQLEAKRCSDHEQPKHYTTNKISSWENLPIGYWNRLRILIYLEIQIAE